MQLGAMLAEAGTLAKSIRATADVTFRLVEDAPTITKIAIDATGDVPGISADDFEAKAQEAKAACLISRALGAVPEITLQATLTGQS
jgi:osmotically inducible protein OsmC